MSFRTEVVKRFGFDETLSGYGLYEDRDASIEAWGHGAVVSAPQARVFHYRSPERRDRGRVLGVQQVLNLGYIVAKHSRSGDPARKLLHRFAMYKVSLYLLGARDGFGRDRLAGAWAATRALRSFDGVEGVQARHVYRREFERCCGSGV